MIRTIKELFQFLIRGRKFWLLPIVLFLLILSVLFILGQSTIFAPFIYTIF